MIDCCSQVRFLGSLEAIIGCLHYNIQFITTLLGLILFFVVMFGGFGLELFMGKLQGRCVYGARILQIAMTSTKWLLPPVIYGTVWWAGTPTTFVQARGTVVLPQAFCNSDR